jgi:hypothetical protein
MILKNIQGASKKSGIWKSVTFNELSNDFHQMNLITCKNVVHCGYLECKSCSDNQLLAEIWQDRDMASQTF